MAAGTIHAELKGKMDNAAEALRAQLAKLRTGRAHPSLIEHITVEYYGSLVPVNQVASVTTDGPHTLCVCPWEKAMVPTIEKAILSSDLGLNPATSGDVIRIPLPPLTEERRRELGKIARDDGEKAKVSMRNARREANQKIKNLLKNKEIGDDDARAHETRVQEITDQCIAQVDTIVSNKGKDLLSL